MTSRALVSLVASVLLVCISHGSASSAELKIFTSRAISTVLTEIGPEFEKSSGHKLNVNWLLGYSIFVAIALLLLNLGAKVNNPRFWMEAFKFFVVYTGGPMLLRSFVVAWSTRQRRSESAA